MQERIRVLHCPNLVGGNPQQLAKTERELELDSWAVAFSQNYLSYPCDEILWADGDSIPTREVKRWKLLYRALKDFDVIHFNFGMSIMPSSINLKPGPNSRLRGTLRKLYWIYSNIFSLKDLPLLKRAGKGIFVTYQGDDARQGDFCRSHFDIHFANEVEPGYYSAESDARKRRDIAVFNRYADKIYALNPDLLHVLPTRAQFMPYSHIDLREWQPANYASTSKTRPLVIHAPSHGGVKGTRYVLEAVSRLKAEGIQFDFTLVEKLSHIEARCVYEKADLVVDQLLSGWYGGLSVEMMALGKPVICYMRGDDLKFIDNEMREELPIINADPSNIFEVLRECLTVRRYQLSNMGHKGRLFVEKWHNPSKIAEMLKHDYMAAVVSSPCVDNVDKLIP